MSVPSIEDRGGVVRWFEAEDGARLRTASFPATGAGDGRLLFFPGFSEFIEKHLETIGDFQKRGFAVWTLDWRGQGLSERSLANRDKGHIGDFDRFLADLDLLLADVVPHGPLTLVGHSMGGHLALRLAHDRPARIARAVLIAPMIDLVLPWGTHGLAQLAAIGLSWAGFEDHYAPGAQDYGPWRETFEGNVLTSDRRRFLETAQQVRANPALGIGGPTVGWTNAAFRSIGEIRSPGYVEGVFAPTLIVAAGLDALVDTGAARALVRRLPRGRFVVIEEALHEILQERDDLRDRFWRTFDAFVDETGGGDGGKTQG
ncbi:MAG: alpha/beta hydrolase [Alphaproteobacteria bacterium]|nr:alpha/beta hydrolase [Alphaproteobacteria bacterium]